MNLTEQEKQLMIDKLTENDNNEQLNKSDIAVEYKNTADNRNFTDSKRPGRKGIIGEEQILKATQTLTEYMNYKSAYDNRFIENQKWFRQRHWDIIKQNTKDTKTDPEPTSAYLFNAIINKHADAMDNYPEPVILPRSEDDKEAAETLSSILPCILEQSDFQETYSENWYDKLIAGCALYGVFWDRHAYYGLGDVSIKRCEILKFFCEPNIEDIQQSKNIFYIDLVDIDVAEEMYPELKGELKTGEFGIKEYEKDSNKSESDKVAIVDWYYKKNGKVHYCKYTGNHVIYASENDEKFKNKGYYIHGKYPFVLDPCFPLKGTPFGFGIVDVAKSSQLYIDKLNQVILKNALVNSRPRMFVSSQAGINMKEFADLNNDIVEVENLREDLIYPIKTAELSGASLSILDRKIDELKETTGNNDFSQGTTSAGVTSGAAIAALQEAGSKSSRDMLKQSYNHYKKMLEMVVDVIRQYYNQERYFRVKGKKGGYDYVTFNNSQMQPQPQGEIGGVDLGMRVPIFDIDLKAQKASPFSTVAQNEMMKEFYQGGVFRPDMADQALIMLDGMEFEGKEQLIQKISENGTMFQQLQQANMRIQQLEAMLMGVAANNTKQQIPTQGKPRQIKSNDGKSVETNNLGNTTAVNNYQAKNAAEKAQTQAKVN